MVGERSQALVNNVYREEQNSFTLKGRSGAVLSEKPDVVAVKGQDVLVVDCKTGTPRNPDQLQVMLYLFALPLADASYGNKSVQGEVVYHADSVTVPYSAIDETFKQQLVRTLRLVISNKPPEWVPSYGECRFCDIGNKDCPDRVDTPPHEAQAEFF